MRLTSLLAEPERRERIPLPEIVREKYVADLIGLLCSDPRSSWHIAYLIGVNYSTIDRWRDLSKAPKSPRSHTIAAVARLYGYTVELVKTSNQWN
jgi:hypothetical protein